MEPQMLTALLEAARAARENAYAPYSHFSVGAALLARDGRIFSGCNVENVSFGATLCAERGALAAAVAAGEREFEAVCISAGPEETLPCGICRQALCEFSPALTVYCDGAGGVTSYRLSELLAHSFARFEPESFGPPREDAGRG